MTIRPKQDASTSFQSLLTAAVVSAMLHPGPLLMFTTHKFVGLARFEERGFKTTVILPALIALICWGEVR